jgi:hypothetical protein
MGMKHLNEVIEMVRTRVRSLTFLTAPSSVTVTKSPTRSYPRLGFLSAGKAVPREPVAAYGSSQLVSGA